MSRRSIPQWRRMTWALLIWSLMAVLAIAAGAALGATEDISEAEIQNCMSEGFLFAAPTRDDCENRLSNADDVVQVTFWLWFVGFLVLLFFWFRHRPGAAASRRRRTSPETLGQGWQRSVDPDELAGISQETDQKSA